MTNWSPEGTRPYDMGYAEGQHTAKEAHEEHEGIYFPWELPPHELSERELAEVKEWYDYKCDERKGGDYISQYDLDMLKIWDKYYEGGVKNE